MSEAIEKTTEKAQEARVLSPNRMKELSYQNTMYSVVVEQGTAPKDLESPDFWAHVAALFRPYDELNVVPDDETWFAKAVVVQCGRNHAMVKVWHVIDLSQGGSAPLAAFEKYEIKWRGPKLKWSVVRKKDGAILLEEQTKDSAVVWLRNYEQTTAS